MNDIRMQDGLFSHLPPGAKCKRCKGQASIPLPSHHANFCRECFLHYFHTGVSRAMKKFALPANAPLLVAVSGGKDSLAVWQVLHDSGYATRGLHIDLGIEGFSEASIEAVSNFAQKRNLPWIHYSLKEIFGYSIPEVRRTTRRKVCSLCGALKRRMLNRLAFKEGYEVLVTGHNLDDEAGRLLGNIVRNRFHYVEKHHPFLPSVHPRLPQKIKPLYRLESHEIRTYCRLMGITPLEEKCPLSRGATSHTFKEALNFLEGKMPGTKRDFLFCFFERNAGRATEGLESMNSCKLCGDPSYNEVCSVCSIKRQLEERSKVKDG